MALSPPGSFTFTVTGPYDGYLTWNNDNPIQHYIEIWENKAAAGYVLKDTIGGSEEFYELAGLDANTNYCYKALVGTYEPAEESAFCTEDCDTTYVVLQAPTLITTTVFSDFIELTWKDNSANEDNFYIYRNVNGGGWPAQGSPTYTVTRNVEYFRDTSITPGDSIQYRICAENDTGPVYSSYLTGSAVTAQSAPNVPTSPTLSEITDEEMRFGWTAPAAGDIVVGYKIQISDTGAFGGEEDEYVVDGDVTDFLFKDLASNDQFWVRVCSYNGVGDSSFTSSVNDWTLTQYVRSEFEIMVRDPSVEVVYIASIDLKMTLSGFTLTGGQTYTYEITVDERGLTFDDVWEDGISLSEKSSIATVEANDGSWWWDPSVKKLYVHASDDTDPDTHFMEGGFVHLIPNVDFQYADSLCTLPSWLSADSIPGVTQEIKPQYEGSFRLSTGSISFKNGESGNENYFDKRFETFTWIGAKLSIYCGKETFDTLAKFKRMFTAYISEKGINDREITFSLRDIRESLERDLILSKYWQTDYPGLDEDFEGREIFKAWGFVNGVAPAQIEVYDATENKSAKFHYHGGRSKTVGSVSVNGVAKVEDTDYYVDLQRSRITFDASFEITEDDIILVDFIAQVNAADEAIEDGADIFKHILNNEANVPTTELNTDWIYETKYANAKTCAVPLYKDTIFTDVIRTLEHSTEAYVLQDGAGRVGLRPQQTTVPSKAKYIWNHQSAAHEHRKGLDSLYWKVKVYYNENPQTQEWSVKEAQDDTIKWKFGKDVNFAEKVLSVYVYFSSSVNAQTLATNILSLLNKTSVEDELPMVLFDVYPGDLIPLSRDRFFNASGTASELVMRLLRIEKNPQTGTTHVKMEPV
jgi:succinate dehydrogenase flavin-adding protein (antitoxin of CptAB toxin-antitoxin module)